MARKMTEDFIGVCQYCLGEYKVNAKKQVVLHGYQRPGYGYTVGQCSGVGHAPFEYDCALTKKRISEMKEEIAKIADQIKMIDDGKVKKVPNSHYLAPNAKERSDRFYRHNAEHDIQFLEPGHRRFESTLARFKANLESEKRFVERMVEYFETFTTDWKRGQIIGIDSPATGRTRLMKDAYNPDTAEQRADYEAAKAVRDAKPGKITINFYRVIPTPSRMDFVNSGMSEEESHAEWRKQWEAADALETAFKVELKAWAKKHFPGKVWIGSGDDQEIRRITGHGAWDQPGGKAVVIAVKPEWQHLDQVMAMFPGAHRYDKDTNRRDPVTNHGIGKGKDIRIWVSGDQLP